MTLSEQAHLRSFSGSSYAVIHDARRRWLARILETRGSVNRFDTQLADHSEALRTYTGSICVDAVTFTTRASNGLANNPVGSHSIGPHRPSAVQALHGKRQTHRLTP